MSDKLGIVTHRGGRFSGEGYRDNSYGEGYGNRYGNSYNSRGAYAGGSYGGSYGNSYGNRREKDDDYGYQPDYGYSNSGYGGSKPTKSYASGYKAETSKPTEKVQASDLGKFHTGVNVRHRKFGDGVIIATKNNNGEVVADVAFKNVGIKSLVLRLAPIEVID